MSDRYAVFGNPITHSQSPLIHHAFAQQTGQDITYDAIEAPLGGFEAAVRRFIDAGGKGLNVTVPFKTNAHDMADECREAAAICGASNCLKLVDGRLIAANFDGIGLARDISVNLGVSLKGARILIAGAGGATRGAVGPLLAAGAEVVIANRTVSKAEDIAALFATPRLKGMSYNTIDGPFDILLNSTSASLTGTGLPIPARAFRNAALAYDLAYGKGKTPFLQLAEQSGTALIADGVGMLVEQAAEAFDWWRGVRPKTQPVIDTLRTPLD